MKSMSLKEIAAACGGQYFGEETKLALAKESIEDLKNALGV